VQPKLFDPDLAAENVMVVSRDYMLKQPSGPSTPKLFLDTKIVPAAVNILGSAEVALGRASARSGIRVRTMLAAAAGLGSAALIALYLRSGSRPGRLGGVTRA
jgi:hypothetical protein